MEAMARNERLSPVILPIVVATLLGIGVAVVGWCANRIVDDEQRIAALEQRTKDCVPKAQGNLTDGIKLE